jgi:hypothetical protein
MKRFRAASMGRASMIKKRTSHITLELDEAKKTEAHLKGAPAHEKKAKAEPAASHKLKAKVHDHKRHERAGVKKATKKGKE